MSFDRKKGRVESLLLYYQVFFSSKSNNRLGFSDPTKREEEGVREASERGSVSTKDGFFGTKRSSPTAADFRQQQKKCSAQARQRETIAYNPKHLTTPRT